MGCADVRAHKPPVNRAVSEINVTEDATTSEFRSVILKVRATSDVVDPGVRISR